MVGRLTDNKATHDVGNGMNVKLGTIQIFGGTSKEIKLNNGLSSDFSLLKHNKVTTRMSDF